MKTATSQTAETSRGLSTREFMTTGLKAVLGIGLLTGCGDKHQQSDLDFRRSNPALDKVIDRYSSSNLTGFHKYSNSAASYVSAVSTLGRTIESSNNFDATFDWMNAKVFSLGGLSSDGVLKTAALLSLAAKLNQSTPVSEILTLHDKFKQDQKIATSPDDISVTASILTIAALCKGQDYASVSGTFSKLCAEDVGYFGKTRNGAAHTGALLTLASSLNPNGITQAYKDFREFLALDRLNGLGITPNAAAGTAAFLAVAEAFSQKGTTHMSKAFEELIFVQHIANTKDGAFTASAILGVAFATEGNLNK